ncbi:hypothetical protein [Paenibacillus sp. UNC451MF]|nr:hypothetical protein [Paenibacillus sp. UNC451MF]
MPLDHDCEGKKVLVPTLDQHIDVDRVAFVEDKVPLLLGAQLKFTFD